ncbi:MAG: hypothetical protein U0Q16_07410 [Bryobacteraceae bacterium]
MLALATLLVVLTPAESAEIERGRALGRLVAVTEPGDVTILGAVRIHAPRERVFRWTLDIANFKHSSLVLDAGSLADLDRLRLARHETAPLAECAPGRCGVKLTAPEIAVLRGVDADTASRRAREVVLDLVARLRRNALDPVQDKAVPVDPAAVFQSLLERSRELRDAAPALYARLAAGRVCDRDMFYWSRERYGFGFKTTLNLYHVSFDHASPALDVVVSRQVRSTHYFDGSLSVTVLADAPGGDTYLAYTNTSRVDLLRGGVSGWKRILFERRVPAEIRKQLELMRLSAESY